MKGYGVGRFAASLLGSDSVYYLQVTDTDTCAVFVSCMHFTVNFTFTHTNIYGYSYGYTHTYAFQ